MSTVEQFCGFPFINNAGVACDRQIPNEAWREEEGMLEFNYIKEILL